MAADNPGVSGRLTLSVALLSLSALALEVLVTRIYSVTLYYHYAFMVVSLAMLGISVGGLWVYLRPVPADDDAMHTALAKASVGYAVTAVGAMLLHLFLGQRSLPEALYLLLNYVAFAAPFAFVGTFFSLAFRAGAAQVGKLYAADLVGAGVGAVGAALILGTLDAPGAVVAAAILGLAPVVLLRQFRMPGLIAGLALAALLVSHLATGWLWPRWVKGAQVPPDAVEAQHWNAYSQIRVLSAKMIGHPGWAVKANKDDPQVEFKQLDIDAGAGTWIIKGGTKNASLKFLDADLTNAAYQFSQPKNVLVIGVGGGRDLLSALHFGVDHVTGVEINPIFKALLTGPYADYSGHLAADPRVSIVVDDGRAFLEATDRQFDLIQLSLVDTWAATAAGAFVLSENSLYTREAMATYLKHLTPNGVLSISRHSFIPPSQDLRVVTTARPAMEDLGITDFANHVAVLRMSHKKGSGSGVALLKRAAFQPQEVAKLQDAATRFGMELVHAPGVAAAPTPSGEIYHGFIAAPDIAPLLDAYPHDVEAATDDHPFFFHMVRFGDVVHSWFGMGNMQLRGPEQEMNVHAVSVLFQLLVLVSGLTALVIGLPLFLRHRRSGQGERVDKADLLYFGGIGVGFMLVEVPLVQRFSVYLGHPVLSLAVVLTAMLLFSGLGAYLTGRWSDTQLRNHGRWLFFAVVAVALVGAVVLDPVLAATRGMALAGRLALAVALLIPLAIPLGTAFPAGVRLLGGQDGARVPWYWGVNGACSVVGSVGVMAVALFLGFKTALLLGCLCYLVAWAAWERRVKAGPIAA